ncbi:hypothetical protein WICPIJ_004219 [Wickerhamomyces pijperi]|uniref:DDE Tnp4 domain-containing protein n=1 Tax=Wickerhamomyces pijperi TaxID=599730 RepID=A0A9P8Q621_WICPI|nr:hypothetical protein WICPIJ_004219 [Wickerhamomyces pijperi]
MKGGTWTKFDIEKIALSEYLSLFQLHKRDIYLLSNALRLKELTTSKSFCRMVNKTTDPVTVMCLFLYRMIKKATLQELKHIFLLSEPAISFIFNKSIEHIFPLIENQTIFNESLLGLQQLESYKMAIQTKFDQIITSSYSASKLEDPDLANTGCIGFLDGTGVKVRKPLHDPLQVSLYNGNKKKHLLVYQVLTLPNGLVGHCSFPGNGARHDLTVLDQSNLIPKLKALWDYNDGYCLLGDKAYDTFQNKDKMIIASQKHSKKDNSAVRFAKKVKNRLFSKIRIVNEWNMTLISGHFKYPFDGDRKVLSE